MGLFGTRYLISAKKSYFLTFRNKSRTGLALQGAELMTTLVKVVVTLAGTCFVMWYLLNKAETFTGMSVKDLSSVTGPMVLALITSWYVGQVFGGSLDACVATTLLCTSCDEEMFARAQRFANPELNAILDPLSSEKHDELMPMALGQVPKESSKRHKIGPVDDNGVDAVINTYAYDNPESARPEYKGLSPFDDDVVMTSRSTHQPNLFYNRPDTTRSGRTPDEEAVEDGRPRFSPSSGSQASKGSKRGGSRQK